jgi:hypothetical protein
MKYALAILFFQGFLSTLIFGQNTKDYRAVTTKYSDGTTLTLGGYGDPSQYSFSNKSSAGSNNTNSTSMTFSKAKLSKKEEKQQRIDMIEWGKMWTYPSCDECKNENKSKNAYKEFIELVNEKRYGEALDLKQKEVNENFTEAKPDEMSLYRYHGLVIFCERQCILKHPESSLNSIHHEGIQRATRRINSQLEKDLAKPGRNINEYKLQVYSIAGIYDEAKKIYSAMTKAGEKVDKATLIAAELRSSKPDEALIVKNTNAIFEEKLKTIKAYTLEQSNLRVTDEAALGSFLIEILYTLSQVEHSIRTAGLQSLLKNTYDSLNASFTTAEGKERLLLAKAYFTEFGI